MSMLDLDAPIRRVVSFDEMNIDRAKYYYIAYIYKNTIHTRPIKIDKILSVYSSSVGTKYLRTEVEWTYYFETESSIYKKIFDAKFWKKIFGFGTKVISEKITESWKIIRTESWATLDFYLIGKTQDEAKLRLIMAAKKTPYPLKEDMQIIDTFLDEYNVSSPELVMKAMNYKIDEQYGGITNYSEYFIDIEGDLRNVV